MNCNRTDIRWVRFPDGTVLVVSVVGWSYPNPDVTSSEIYDPSSNSWGNLAKLGVTVYDGFTLTLLDNGKVLRAGGSLVWGASSQPPTPTAELFDPSNNAWAPAAPMRSGRAYHTAVQVAPNVVMVVGGVLGNTDVTPVEFYNAATDMWTPGAAPNHSGFRATLTRLPDGSMLLAGGYAWNPNAEIFSL